MFAVLGKLVGMPEGDDEKGIHLKEGGGGVAEDFVHAAIDVETALTPDIVKIEDDGGGVDELLEEVLALLEGGFGDAAVGDIEHESAEDSSGVRGDDAHHVADPDDATVGADHAVFAFKAIAFFHGLGLDDLDPFPVFGMDMGAPETLFEPFFDGKTEEGNGLGADVGELAGVQVRLPGEEIHGLDEEAEFFFAFAELGLGPAMFGDIDDAAFEESGLVVAVVDGPGVLGDPHAAAIGPIDFGFEIADKSLLPDQADELGAASGIYIELCI